MMTSEYRLTGSLTLCVSKKEMKKQQWHSLIAEFELTGKL